MLKQNKDTQRYTAAYMAEHYPPWHYEYLLGGIVGTTKAVLTRRLDEEYLDNALFALIISGLLLSLAYVREVLLRKDFIAANMPLTETSADRGLVLRSLPGIVRNAIAVFDAKRKEERRRAREEKNQELDGNGNITFSD